MRLKTVVCWAMIVGVVLLMQPLVSRGEDSPGKALFETMHCQMCHKEARSGFAPSLKEIAAGYGGDVVQLTAYFKGRAEARINPDKAAKMKRQLEKIQQKSDEEIKQLAQYVASFN